MNHQFIDKLCSLIFIRLKSLLVFHVICLVFQMVNRTKELVLIWLNYLLLVLLLILKGCQDWNSSILDGIASSQLIVYKNKESFEKRDSEVEQERKVPLKSSCCCWSQRGNDFGPRSSWYWISLQTQKHQFHNKKQSIIAYAMKKSI